jgi:hypothetical protein
MAEMRQGRNGGKLKSGNTINVGRPKLPDLKEAMAKILGEEKDGKIALEAILAGLRAKAVRGDARAAELLLKYTYRQPTQEVDITTNGKEIRSWTVKSV